MFHVKHRRCSLLPSLVMRAWAPSRSGPPKIRTQPPGSRSCRSISGSRPTARMVTVLAGHPLKLSLRALSTVTLSRPISRAASRRKAQRFALGSNSVKGRSGRRAARTSPGDPFPEPTSITLPSSRASAPRTGDTRVLKAASLVSAPVRLIFADQRPRHSRYRSRRDLTPPSVIVKSPPNTIRHQPNSPLRRCLPLREQVRREVHGQRLLGHGHQI